jgi:hypothetical protein
MNMGKCFHCMLDLYVLAYRLSHSYVQNHLLQYVRHSRMPEMFLVYIQTFQNLHKESVHCRNRANKAIPHKFVGRNSKLAEGRAREAKRRHIESLAFATAAMFVQTNNCLDILGASPSTTELAVLVVHLI